VFGVVLALLTGGAITLSSKLPKPAAALEPRLAPSPLDPAIITTHLLQMRDQMALP
jgi:hypothetical protein